MELAHAPDQGRTFAQSGKNLQFLLLPEVADAADVSYTKTTLVRSPLIVDMYPKFRVSLCKPACGLTSSSINDEDDQTLREPETDSYFGTELADDDDMWDLQDAMPKSEHPAPEPGPPAESSYASVEVLIKASSMVVEDVEYVLPAGVKAAVLIPHSSTLGGSNTNLDALNPSTETDTADLAENPPRPSAHSEHLHSEDSLLISLLSGYSLLIRVWHVPRGFSDALFSLALQRAPTYSHVFRPFVVQWWQLSHEETAPPELGLSAEPMSCSGYVGAESRIESGFSLAAHPAGLAVVSASAHSLFRIHSCELTTAGLQLSPHFNVPINGVILHLCFAHPLNTLDASNHILFLTLSLSNLKRLELCLHSWFAHEPLEGNLNSSMLPLNNNFPFPIAIVPLANNNSFLLICPEELIIVTVNNIWSADYSFTRTAYTGAFPTAFSIPEFPVLSDEEDIINSDLCDEVLLAASDGIIYSVIVQENKTLECIPIIRVADPISVFNLLPHENGYILTFASDTGAAKKVYIPELFLQEDDKMPYTDASLRKDYKNWTPVVDALVIDSVASRTLVNGCLQELWVLSGIGKRTKLSHISLGYLIRKDSTVNDAYRKALSLFGFSRNGEHFMACCMPFETRFLEVKTSLENASLLSVLSGLYTLWCGNITLEVVIQFTPSQVLVTDLSQRKCLDIETIVFAKSLREYAVFIVETDNLLRLEVRKVDFGSHDWLPLIHSVPVSSQVSALSLTETEDKLYVTIGTFGGNCSCMAFGKSDSSLYEFFSVDLEALAKEIAIPHDVLFFPNTNKAFVGTKSGSFLVLEFSRGGPQQNGEHSEFQSQTYHSQVSVLQKLQLCSMPILLLLSRNDPNLLVVYGRNVWLFNFYTLKVPSKVSFGEKVDKPITLMVELPVDTPQYLNMMFVKEDGLGTGSLFTHKSVIVKQIGIGEPAKKLAFLDAQALFIVLSKSKSPLTRLKFADRKNYRMLPTVEFDLRSGVQRQDPIFGAQEYPSCCLIWRIQRGERLSKKVIVGSTIEGKAGNLKILDISKVALEGSQATIIKQVELISIAREQPITCVEQMGSIILFACGPSIYSTSYQLESKKLKPVQKLVSLSSDVTFISTTKDHVLLVNSKMDSLLAFRYIEATGDSEDRLEVVFKDQVPRSLVNNTTLGKMYFAGDKLHSQLVIMDPNENSKYRYSSSIKNPISDTSMRNTISDTSMGNSFSRTSLDSGSCLVSSSGSDETPSLSTRFKLSMIPRVYSAKFAALWSSPAEHIVTVGVNGEVVSFKPEKYEQMAQLDHMLAQAYDLGPHAPRRSLVERLARPFLGKVTGKGFYSLNKPFFDYAANRNHPIVVDCDMDELVTLSDWGIVL